MSVNYEELENIGMGLPCANCGEDTSWLPCWNCGGEGGWDGEDLMSEDPLWYGPDDYRGCGECRGAGGHPYCLTCKKIVKVVEQEDLA